MKNIFRAIGDGWRATPKTVLAATLLLAATLVYINYHFRLEPRLMALPVEVRLPAWYAVFALAFWLPYGFYQLHGSLPPLWKTAALPFLLAAPALFALKLALPLPPGAAPYWQPVLYYPFKLLLVGALLWLLWRWRGGGAPFWGSSGKALRPAPYLGMLLFMLPLIALASTQKDFLHVYPKWQHLPVVREAGVAGKLLYELSYGSDFVTIELFFRGFLVLAFARYAGRAALLPMAVFYCAIHFGKPLGECISSFFGGLLLGVVTLQTRSIWGGLIVHLGIAWLMELGGYIGHTMNPGLPFY